MAAQFACGVQAEATQERPAPQGIPQPPQWASVERVSVSQPLAGLPSQLPVDGAQSATAQADAAHTAVATLGSAQARPQPPQCAALVRVSVSQPLAALPSQSAKPAVQITAQAPTAHAGTALGAPGQAWPQVPQCETATRVSVSQPLVALPSQSPKPASHEPTVHRLATQAAVALGGSQRVPQAPQAAVLVVVSASQPLAASPSQSAKPASQE
jgi:hypothetical protein